MDILREVLKIFFAFLWTWFLFVGIKAIRDNERREKEIRSNAMREAADEAGASWSALWLDEKRRGAEEAERLNAIIETQRQQIDQLQREMEFKNVILTKARICEVRSKDGRK